MFSRPPSPHQTKSYPINMYAIDKYGAVFDAHVHTYFDYHDGLISPSELISLTKRNHFNWVLAMAHDTVRGAVIIKRLAKENGLPCIAGMEVSTIHNHFLAYGVQEWPYCRDSLTPEDAVDHLRAQGCAIFISHPFANARGKKKNPVGTWTPDILKRLDFDGIEWFNAQSYIFNKKTQEVYKNMPKGRRIAGSDVHHPLSFGYAYTQVDMNSTDPDELVSAMKKGKCTPYGRDVPPYIALRTSLASIFRNQILKRRKVEGRWTKAVGDHVGSIKPAHIMHPVEWKNKFMSTKPLNPRVAEWLT